MLYDKKILAMIPARGGSKGVPHKNILEVAGKPLMAWTIESALFSRYVDRVIVSTDDEEIAIIARQWGAEVPFIRPPEYAGDDVPLTAPALHAIEKIPGFDYLVTLQPTTPLRNAPVLDSCLDFAISRGLLACASMTEPTQKPYWMYRIMGDGTIDPLMKEQYPSRQLFPPYHTLNGAIYLVSVEWFIKTKTFLSRETRAFLMSQMDSIDVDTELDLEIADYLLRRYRLRG
jgi:CMP-N,N'-diacetyllegionaminic acid synthase